VSTGFSFTFKGRPRRLDQGAGPRPECVGAAQHHPHPGERHDRGAERQTHADRQHGSAVVEDVRPPPLFMAPAPLRPRRSTKSSAKLPDGAEVALDHPAGVIIPRKTVNELRKLLDEVTGTVEIALSDTRIQFKVDQILLTGRPTVGCPAGAAGAARNSGPQSTICRKVARPCAAMRRLPWDAI
jgi:hypothetical protein